MDHCRNRAGHSALPLLACGGDEKSQKKNKSCYRCSDYGCRGLDLDTWLLYHVWYKNKNYYRIRQNPE